MLFINLTSFIQAVLVCAYWVSESRFHLHVERCLQTSNHTRVCHWVSKCGFVAGQLRLSSYGNVEFHRMRVLLGMIAGCQFASWELADDKVFRRLPALRTIFEVLHLANAVIASCSFFCATYLMYCLLMRETSPSPSPGQRSARHRCPGRTSVGTESCLVLIVLRLSFHHLSGP